MTRVLLTGDRHGLEHSVTILGGFPGGSEAKNLPANVGDMYLILGLGRSLGEGNGNPLQNSCLRNSMDRGAWRAIVHDTAKSYTTERLNSKQTTSYFRS